MKLLSLDGLKRLISPHRKKDKNESSSFTRSDSFKRISIRKNYFENGAKCRNPAKFACKKSVCESRHVRSETTISTSTVVAETQIGIRRREERRKPCSKSSYYVNRNFAQETTNNRSLSTKCSFPSSSCGMTGECYKRDGAVKGIRTDSAISVSLGRIWTDAPPMITNVPRSLELPKPASSRLRIESNSNGQRAHHSLDSALKDKRNAAPALSRGDGGFNRRLSTSKDSGLSFSISISRLSPVISDESGLPFREVTKNTPQIPPRCRKGRRNKNQIGNGDIVRDYRNGNGEACETTASRFSKPTDTPKSDPVIFVPPPRKRRSKARKSYEVQEIRACSSACGDRVAATYKDDKMGNGGGGGGCRKRNENTAKLYESISEERDDAYEYDTKKGIVSGLRDQYGDDLWISDDNSESAARDDSEIGCTVKCDKIRAANSSPDARRRTRVARKRSIHKNIKYAAKPVLRVPSTLKRTGNRKLSTKKCSRLEKN